MSVGPPSRISPPRPSRTSTPGSGRPSYTTPPQLSVGPEVPVPRAPPAPPARRTAGPSPAPRARRGYDQGNLGPGRDPVLPSAGDRRTPAKVLVGRGRRDQEGRPGDKEEIAQRRGREAMVDRQQRRAGAPC